MENHPIIILDYQCPRSFNMHFPWFSDTHIVDLSPTSLSLSLSSLSLSLPGLSRVAFIGLVVGAGLGGLLLITLVIVMVAACVYYFVRKRKKQGSHKYGGKKGKKHKNRNLYDAY